MVATISSTGPIAGSVSRAVSTSDGKSICKQFQPRLIFQSDKGLFVYQDGLSKDQLKIIYRN